MEVKRINIFSSLSKSQYLELIPDLKKDKTQEVITLAFTLVALILFGIFAINPTLTTIANLRRQLDDNKYVNEKLQEKITNLRQLQQQYIFIQNDVPAVLAAVPQNPTVPYLLGQLQSLAQSSHIQITRLQASQVDLSKNGAGITAGPKEQKKPYSSFEFIIEGVGTKEDITHFITSLNNFDRITTLDSISLTKGKQITDPLFLNVSGKAYFMK